jgi:hypothetical protein
MGLPYHVHGSFLSGIIASRGSLSSQVKISLYENLPLRNGGNGESYSAV